MNISIVTGSYNRAERLRNMVNSVRQAFADVHGLSYEIVVIDGGSQDGTQDWCKAQPDIRLIEHGSLKGAVKAFNDGATAATGDYVILANDDITFVGDSVLRAWVFMQRHPRCGIGCFYQDRNRQSMEDSNPSKWHVEVMPCVIDGQQRHLPYGQVCIVPKWLGDRLNWWGDYLHTYGGDNELSSNVYEAGWQVLPMDGCKIRDDSPDDALRRINNIRGAKDPRAVRGAHPDSYAWGRKWRHEGTVLVGPIVRSEPSILGEVSTVERILYLPIFETGWDVQRQQKHGLRDALSHRGAIDEFDYVGITARDGRDSMLNQLAGHIDTLRPTLILTQLHGCDPIGPRQVESIRKIAGCRIVNWNGDYWPENLLSPQGMELAKSVDWQLTVNLAALEEYRKQGIAAAYWQIGWEPDGVSDEQVPMVCDAVFLGNGYSKERTAFVQQMRSLKDFTFHLWGQGWPNGWSRGQNLYDFKSAVRIYRGARFSLGDSQWPESGFVSNRVMQALVAGGSVLCHQWFRGMENLGLEDGKTCIIWRSFDELVEKLNYYLNREEERAKIAVAGKALALDRHSFDRRVDELFMLLNEEGEDWR